jgi:hypothetical protein
MMRRPRRATLLWLALVAALLALRVPSLVQPAGGDQGLYVYEAQRVLAGDVLVPRCLGSEAAGARLSVCRALDPLAA